MASTPRPSQAKSARRISLGLAALALASACGESSTPGVSVTTSQSDVSFGKPAVAGPPPAAPEQPFVPVGPGVIVQPPPPLPDIVFNPPTSPPTSGQPPVSDICPGPPVFATAPTAATTFVQDQPKPGFYLWQLIKSEEVADNIFSKTAKYTNYEIRNVSPITKRPNPSGEPTTVFTYDQVAPIGGGDTITYTYQVKQNAPGAGVGQVSNIGTPRRASEPDAGVAIKSEVRRNAAGEITGRFDPVTPVLILPLPIIGGASFVGAGTDPLTRSSLQVQGVVKGPDRIIACTSFVQGYRVDAEVTSSGAQGQSAPVVTQTFTIQTQAGGLLIGNVQKPTGSKVSDMSLVGNHVPTAKPRDIPKALQP